MTAKNMIKPKLQILKYYNYLQCSRYLEQKYKYKERDFADSHGYEKKAAKIATKKFKNKSWYTTIPINYTKIEQKTSDYFDELMKNKPPYLDFWHYILDQVEISNGGYFIMYKDWIDEAESWQKEILSYYFKEFDKDNIGEINFYTSW